uniref:exodeoxyribonuclease I n=1 Tax=Ningiella ruwaisensis TaxID=2364274 RepID=UPI00109EEA2F|nr:exodeoxyribonuclease I [Ningiella ruwaisensis]
MSSILWHDYETWGVNPRQDFPVQFAGIRTDLELNVIDKPLNYFCQIPNDYLPHPEACLVTGITPQQSLRDGYIEAEFAKKLYALMSLPETCTAGYNSIKFDEEVSRHLFYRNFYPVYEREYENGNSRWDIIDLVRAAYALRPDGIEWPVYEENGKPCFKLEMLSKANGIEHADAHDALSDVYATIGMAKLIKEKHPKLYHFFFSLRNKHEVAKIIDVYKQQAFLYVSGFIDSSQGCCAWMMPLCFHPQNKNIVLAVNLSKDTDTLLDNDIDAFSDPDFVSDLFASKQMPFMQIAINKCPFVAPAKMLTPELAQRLGIDRQLCLHRYQQLKQSSDIIQKCIAVFDKPFTDTSDQDIDTQLYTRDFPGPADKAVMSQIRDSKPVSLTAIYDNLPNGDIKRQLFRYIGRNYPAQMNESMLARWQAHRKSRFIESGNQGYLSIEAFQLSIESLVQEHAGNANKLAILRALERYASEL